jgi:hypothetical protein
MVEARTHKRYDFLGLAVIKAQNGHRINISALVENISKKGMRLHTYQSFTPESNIVMELSFTTRAGKAKAYIKGKVARSDRDDDINVIGVSFDQEISSDNHPVLSRYYDKGIVRMVLKR